ncbi:MAG: carboxylating nicotinate-nucleotide diphosphorylase [Spartobacteria bacterium]
MKELDPIDIALREDIGTGDITTETFVPAELQASARIIAREKAIIAGTQTAASVFQRVDPSVQVTIVRADGAEAGPGDVIVDLRGPARSILTAERVALNFLQRLSGIATLTKQFVDAAANERVQILDTRKTTPGLRALEKAAVVAGGGGNHRSGLYDMVLLKDNHLACHPDFNALAESVRKLRAERPDVRIEIEADDLRQVRAILKKVDVDLVLLDNMRPAQLREAVALGKNTKVKFEASGGVNLKSVRIIAATGVDYISIGALTHSAGAIDLSLEMTNVGA